MSVYKRTDSAVYSYDFRVAGVRYSGSTSTDSFEEAVAYEQTLKQEATGLSPFCRSVIKKAVFGRCVRRNRRGYVYMLRSGYFVKIGHSLNPTERIQTISTSTPDGCELLFSIPGDIQFEREMHAQFQACHYRREWFFCCGKLKLFIEHFERSKYAADAANAAGTPRNVEPELATA